jgi:hypothetical protein
MRPPQYRARGLASLVAGDLRALLRNHLEGCNSELERTDISDHKAYGLSVVCC